MTAASGLTVVFERTGCAPVRVEAENGERALIRALILLLANTKLLSGDRLTVTAAD
jgi:hypothetical protein